MRRFVWQLLLMAPLCANCLLAAAAPIEIVSPLDYQVFQRHSRLSGTVHIAGRFDGDGNVQFRIAGTPLAGELSPDWMPLQADPQTRTFSAQTPVPAGGWYRVEVRLLKNGETVGQCAVEHVGIGEVFVVAGQSNSANHGEQRQRPASDRVVSHSGSRWAIADDPQPGASGQGGSFIPAFGDALAKQFGVPIGAVCLGVGGTSVREWLPKGDPVAAPPTTGANVVAVGPNAWACSGELFGRLTQRIGSLGPHGFRAVLWHQGESDANQPAGCNITPDQYLQYLVRLIGATREAAGWNVPWFVAQVSYHTPADPGSPELRAAQKSLSTDRTALAGPNTDELGGEYREAAGQGVHFNARGLRRHGELWAESVGAWLDRQLAAEDRLHNNAEGYRLWTSLVRPHLQTRGE